MSSLQVTPNNDENLPAVPEEAKDNFDIARGNMMTAIDMVKKAADEALIIANQTGDPEALSAFSSIMSTFISANKALMDVDKREQEFQTKKTKKNSGTTNVTNQNLFVGTTAELIAALQKARASIPAIEEIADDKSSE